MNDEKSAELEARRRFLKTVGAAAVTVPAAALLLSAASRPAMAQNRYGGDWEDDKEEATRDLSGPDATESRQKVDYRLNP